MKRFCALFAAFALTLWTSTPVFAQEAEASEEAPREEARHGVLGPVVMMGAGALVLAGGLSLFLLGAADKDAVESAPDGARWDDFATQAERGPILLGAGQIMMAAGLIVFGAAITWLVLALADADPDPFGTAELQLDVGPMGASLGGRF